MDGYFTAPATGKHPGVIFWPDIASLRPVKMQMADRLAGEGYAVLVMNPYYRDVTAPRFEDFAEFAANQGFQMVKPWRDRLNANTIISDARGAVQWLGRAAASRHDEGRRHAGLLHGRAVSPSGRRRRCRRA